MNWNNLVNLIIKNEGSKSSILTSDLLEAKVLKGELLVQLVMSENLNMTVNLISEAELDLDEYFQPYSVEIIFKNKNKIRIEYLLYRLKKRFLFLKNRSVKMEIKNRELKVFLGDDFAMGQWNGKNVGKYLQELVSINLGIQIDNINVVVMEEDSEVKRKYKDKVDNSIIKSIKSTEYKIDVKNKVDTKNKHVILGKSLLEEGVEVYEINQGEKNITLIGEVYKLEERSIKNSSKIYSFMLLGKRAGCNCKFFLRKDNYLGEFKNNMKVKINGDINFDQYRGDFVLDVKSINSYFENKIATDSEARVELHLHTKMSSMDGALDIEELMKKMIKLGHKRVAITDHGVVQGFPEARILADKYGIEIVFGMEAYLYDDSNKENLKKTADHLNILVLNYIGLNNLYQIVTESHLKHFYRRPKIPRSFIENHREGLLLGSACEGGTLYRAFVRNESAEKIEKIVSFYDFLEIQPVSNNMYLVREKILENEEAIREINLKIYNLGKKLGIPVIATGDVHFLEPEDNIYRGILMKSKGFNDVSQPELYYKTSDEMLKEFSYLGEEAAREVVILNPKKITEECDFEIKPVPDEFYPPFIEGAEEQVKEIVYKGAKELYGSKLPKEVQFRINKELDAIIKHGFSVLYLSAHKLVKKSNEDGYIVGSRGSVGSSFVATLMGITEVNPLAPHYICPNCKKSIFLNNFEFTCGADMPDKICPCGTQLIKEGHTIPFETFLGFNGDKVPDIDLNFSGEYQSTIHKYCESIFGEGKVFKAGTISTVAEKTAYGFTKNYFEKEGIPIPKDPSILSLSRGCKGTKRTTGQHPGGLMIVPKSEDVHKFTPLQRPADLVSSDIITTHFDYHSISERLVKLDLLGHDDPTIIKYVEEMTNVKASVVNLDDKNVLDLFKGTKILGFEKDKFIKVGTLGIPEFGTSFVRGMLLETKPSKFSDLVRISGFSHGTDVWLNNARDLIIQGKVTLKEAISTRDDIMIYLLQKKMEPLESFKIMESVRKGKGITDDQENLMKEKGVPKWYIDSCKKISYMFPKAHATAYVTMAFRLAYYKINFKEEFYASFFSVRGDNFLVRDYLGDIYKIEKRLEKFINNDGHLTNKEKDEKYITEIVYEMKLRGIDFLPVSIRDSESFKFKIVNGNLLPPFVSIGGLGEKVAAEIVSARKDRYFLSIDDLRRRGKVNGTTMEEMREMGVLKELPESEQLELF